MTSGTRVRGRTTINLTSDQVPPTADSRAVTLLHPPPPKKKKKRKKKEEPLIAGYDKFHKNCSISPKLPSPDLTMMSFSISCKYSSKKLSSSLEQRSFSTKITTVCLHCGDLAFDPLFKALVHKTIFLATCLAISLRRCDTSCTDRCLV